MSWVFFRFLYWVTLLVLGQLAGQGLSTVGDKSSRAQA